MAKIKATVTVWHINGYNMKKIHFQIIADSRSCDDIKAKIEKLDSDLQKLLTENSIKFTTHDWCGLLEWKDGTRQYRTDYTIEKTKDFTYKKVMTLINSVQAPFYKIK